MRPFRFVRLLECVWNLAKFCILFLVKIFSFSSSLRVARSPQSSTFDLCKRVCKSDQMTEWDKIDNIDQNALANLCDRVANEFLSLSSPLGPPGIN